LTGLKRTPIISARCGTASSAGLVAGPHPSRNPHVFSLASLHGLLE
jgi:hypothetical protein